MRAPTAYARYTWALLCVLVVAAARTVSAQELAGDTPFAVYWGVGGMHEANPDRRINLGSGPISRGIVILSAADCGMYPVAGPHIIEMSPGGRELYIQRHLQKLRTDVAVNIPDASYAGFVAIDAGAWLPFWSGHENTPSDQGPSAADRDFLDDWRDYIRDSHPELLEGKKPEKLEDVFRETWLETTREFWTRTLDECKALRPAAKWGMCGLPITTYFPWLASGDPLQQERLRLLKRAHDVELAWLFDRVNAHFPSLPVPFEGVEARPNWNVRQVNKGDIEQYLRLNCVEAIRISRDRPVIALIHPLYPDTEAALRGRWLNEEDLLACFEVPRACGAAGVAIRGQIGDFNHPQDEWQRVVENHLNPLAEIFASAAAAPLQTPATAAGPGAASGPVAQTPTEGQHRPTPLAPTTDGPRFSSPTFSSRELDGAIDRLRYNVFKSKNGKKIPLRREPPHQAPTATAPERAEPANPDQPK